MYRVLSDLQRLSEAAEGTPHDMSFKDIVLAFTKSSKVLLSRVLQ